MPCPEVHCRRLTAVCCVMQGWPGDEGELGMGHAVGPEWTDSLAAYGVSSPAGLQVEYGCEASALVGTQLLLHTGASTRVQALIWQEIAEGSI